MILEHSHWDSVSLFFCGHSFLLQWGKIPSFVQPQPCSHYFDRRTLTSSFLSSHISNCYYLVHPIKHAGIKESLLMYPVTSFQGHAPWLNCSSSHKHFLLHLCRATLVLLGCEQLLHPLLRLPLNGPTWSLPWLSLTCFPHWDHGSPFSLENFKMSFCCWKLFNES